MFNLLLAALLASLSPAPSPSPPQGRADLRAQLEEQRRIMRGLPPDVPDDLGLVQALTACLGRERGQPGLGPREEDEYDQELEEVRARFPVEFRGALRRRDPNFWAGLNCEEIRRGLRNDVRRGRSPVRRVEEPVAASPSSEAGILSQVASWLGLDIDQEAVMAAQRNVGRQEGNMVDHLALERRQEERGFRVEQPRFPFPMPAADRASSSAHRDLPPLRERFLNSLSAPSGASATPAVPPGHSGPPEYRRGVIGSALNPSSLQPASGNIGLGGRQRDPQAARIPSPQLPAIADLRPQERVSSSPHRPPHVEIVAGRERVMRVQGRPEVIRGMPVRMVSPHPQHVSAASHFRQSRPYPQAQLGAGHSLPAQYPSPVHVRPSQQSPAPGPLPARWVAEPQGAGYYVQRGQPLAHQAAFHPLYQRQMSASPNRMSASPPRHPVASYVGSPRFGGTASPYGSPGVPGYHHDIRRAASHSQGPHMAHPVYPFWDQVHVRRPIVIPPPVPPRAPIAAIPSEGLRRERSQPAPQATRRAFDNPGYQGHLPLHPEGPTGVRPIPCSQAQDQGRNQGQGLTFNYATVQCPITFALGPSVPRPAPVEVPYCVCPQDASEGRCGSILEEPSRGNGASSSQAQPVEAEEQAQRSPPLPVLISLDDGNDSDGEVDGAVVRGRSMSRPRRCARCGKTKRGVEFYPVSSDLSLGLDPVSPSESLDDLDYLGTEEHERQAAVPQP